MSKWNIGKAVDLTAMFGGLHSITSIPDIKNWDTKNARKAISNA